MIDEEKGAWDLVFDIDLVFFFAGGWSVAATRSLRKKLRMWK